MQPLFSFCVHILLSYVCWYFICFPLLHFASWRNGSFMFVFFFLASLISAVSFVLWPSFMLKIYSLFWSALIICPIRCLLCSMVLYARLLSLIISVLAFACTFVVNVAQDVHHTFPCDIVVMSVHACHHTPAFLDIKFYSLTSILHGPHQITWLCPILVLALPCYLTHILKWGHTYTYFNVWFAYYCENREVHTAIPHVITV